MINLNVKYDESNFTNQYKIVEINHNRSKTIQFLQMANVQGIAPPELFPIFVYMIRKDEDIEYCQDWWYFNNNRECITHDCNIVRNGEDIGGTTNPDKDISHLLQEKDLLKKSVKQSPKNDKYDNFPTSDINKLILKIIKQI